jgi:hypothetical protein
VVLAVVVVEGAVLLVAGTGGPLVVEPGALVGGADVTTGGVNGSGPTFAAGSAKTSPGWPVAAASPAASSPPRVRTTPPINDAAARITGSSHFGVCRRG